MATFAACAHQPESRCSLRASSTRRRSASPSISQTSASVSGREVAESVVQLAPVVDHLGRRQQERQHADGGQRGAGVVVDAIFGRHERHRDQAADAAGADPNRPPPVPVAHAVGFVREALVDPFEARATVGRPQRLRRALGARQWICARATVGAIANTANARPNARHGPLVRARVAIHVSTMPTKSTVKKAKHDLSAGKRPSTAAGEFVREEMDHIRKGKHGARS